MSFAGVNYLAVLIAAVAAFAFGATYYTMLGRQWVAALDKDRETLRAGGMAGPLIVSGIAQLVMSLMLAGLIGHLGGPHGIRGGLLAGASVWLGFVVTALAANYAWQRAKAALTLIDSGHWLGVLLVQGAIIGAMGM